MPREKLVYPVSDATKQAIVDASVQVIPARPVMSAAALQKLFVTPVVNAEGKACAIAEIKPDSGGNGSGAQRAVRAAVPVEGREGRQRR